MDTLEDWLDVDPDAYEERKVLVDTQEDWLDNDPDAYERSN